jgi:hypothetical protein
MRPVDAKFPITQLFAGLATRGVVGRPDGSEVEYLVWLYGDYQPYGHAGVDIACPVGTPIRAMRSGTVVYAGWGEDLPGNDSWGPSGYFRRWGMYKNFPGIVTVIKADGTNEFDIYGHQSSNDEVSVGLHVDEAQTIGKSGDTKTRTEKVGPHLHVVTVADPVNYSTDWPRLIFGCVDPTPLFGNTGLVLQGAVTNAATTQAQEEDDMPSAAEIAQEIMNYNVNRQGDGQTGQTNLAAALAWADANNAAIIRATADTVLNTPIKRQGKGAGLGDSTSLGALVAWHDSGTLDVIAAVAASAASDGGTVEQIKDAVAAALAQGTVKVDVTVQGVQSNG